MRCASPPESVAERRSSVRYSSPTSFRNFRRWRISTRILSAMARLFRAQLQASKNCVRLGDVHAHDFGQVLAAHAHVERFLAQARALALRAQRVAAVPAQEDAHVQLVLLGLQVVEEAADEVVRASRARRRSGRRRARRSAPCARPTCGNCPARSGTWAWSTGPPRPHRATATCRESRGPCRNRWCCRSPGSAGRRRTAS